LPLGASLFKNRHDHQELLVKAAGITTVRIICHEDTWAFMLQATRSLEAKPDSLQGTPKDMVAQRLSGPNLVRLLNEMNSKWDTGGFIFPIRWDKVNRALRERAYRALTEIISQVDAAAKPGAAIPDIVIDDLMNDSEKESST
jgi:hypothetical protein